MSRVWPLSSAAGGSLGELLQTDANPEGRSAGAGGDRSGAGGERGEVGGVPGGVPGGVVGGTGEIPVRDFDRPPRLLRQVKPVYPQDAFVKVQGVVLVEFVIDAAGRVSRARVVQSVPMLDDAAVAAVRQWVFSPALRRGTPVATMAQAPVAFRIY